MKTRSTLASCLALIVVALGVLAACGPSGPTPTPAVPTDGVLDVDMRNYVYEPRTFEFKVGETVEFRLISEDEPHTFTVRDLGINWVVPKNEAPQVETFTFNEAGTYRARLHGVWTRRLRDGWQDYRRGVISPDKLPGKEHTHDRRRTDLPRPCALRAYLKRHTLDRSPLLLQLRAGDRSPSHAGRSQAALPDDHPAVLAERLPLGVALDAALRPPLHHQRRGGRG